MHVGFVQKHLIRELLKECAKMQKFDHPNVLKLIGVCLDGGPAPYIIMPFMANGSLLSYLKKERDQLVVDTAAETVSFTSCACRKMISFYCCKMRYVTMCHVFRNLWRRSCWICVCKWPKEWSILLVNESSTETLLLGIACNKFNIILFAASQ